MKAEEFRKLTREELEEKIRSLREELFNLGFRLSTQRLDNPLRLRLLRRDVARGMSVLHQMELAAMAAKKAAAGSRSEAGSGPGAGESGTATGS